jgi:hypothetical protein
VIQVLRGARRTTPLGSLSEGLGTHHMQKEKMKYYIYMVALATILSGVQAFAQHKLSEVSFNTVRNVAVDDEPGVFYSHGLQWWDLDGDNAAVTPYVDRRFPLCYYVGDSMVVDEVRITGALSIPPGSAVWVGGVGPEGRYFGGDWATFEDDYIIGADLACPIDLDNWVRFYNPFEIDWYIEIFPPTGRSIGPILAGISDNRVFVTIGDPVSGDGQPTSHIWESIAQISCEAADGLGQPQDITDAVNAWFEPRGISRVPVRGYNVVDNEPLKYWKYQSETGDTALQLLETGHGRCRQWATLFWLCVKLNNGVGERYTINPRASESLPPSQQTGYDTRILVQNIGDDGSSSMNLTMPLCPWRFSSEPPPIPFASIWSGDFWQAGSIDGQNMTWPNYPAQQIFLDHAVYMSAGKVYDPSYGRKWGSQLEWEKMSLWGYGSTTYGNGRGARKEDDAVVDLLWEVW